MTDTFMILDRWAYHGASRGHVRGDEECAACELPPSDLEHCACGGLRHTFDIGLTFSQEIDTKAVCEDCGKITHTFDYEEWAEWDGGDSQIVEGDVEPVPRTFSTVAASAAIVYPETTFLT